MKDDDETIKYQYLSCALRVSCQIFELKQVKLFLLNLIHL